MLHYHLKHFGPQFVCVQETHLNERYKIKIPGYSWVRLDRPGNEGGGGIAIGVKNGIKFETAPAFKLKNIEAVAIITKIGHQQYTITSAYSPKYTQHFEDDIAKLFESNNTPNLVFGDLNAKHPEWNCDTSNQAGRKLFDLQATVGAFVFSTSDPTYICASNDSRANIDIVLSNATISFDDLCTNNNLFSDHIAIELRLNLETEPIEFKRFNYKDADWPKFADRITALANRIKTPSNKREIETSTDDFTAAVLQARDEAIPTTRIRSYESNFAQDTLLAINERRNLNRQLSRCRNHAEKQRIRATAKFVGSRITKLIERDRCASWTKMTETILETPNRVWQICKTLRGKNAKMPSFVTGDGNHIVDDTSKANLLANNFEQSHVTIGRVTDQYTEHDETIENAAQELRTKTLTDRDIHRITMSELRNNIRQLRPNKAPGPDGILNRLIKQLPYPVLCKMLSIFNAILEFSHWPVKWKIGRVVAIPKAGKNSNMAENYRPISLLDVIGKLLEKILKTRLSHYIEENCHLNAEQFGFRAGRSAPQQVLRVADMLRKNKTRRQNSAVLAMDIAKAFDAVWHSALIVKLAQTGTPIYICKIIQNWLENRQFYVAVGNAKSTMRRILAGVPQGSSLSPLLYSIFVADIPTPPNCSLAVYADDTALIAHSVQARGVATKIAAGFQIVNDYFTKWKIKVNPTKTECLYVPFDGKKRRMPSRPLKLTNDTEIEYADAVRYLGVIIDKKLLFRKHTEKARMKASNAYRAIYGLMARSSRMKAKMKRHLYLAIIRPIMMYGAETWRTAAKTNIQPMQVLQSGCLKMAYRLGRRFPTTRLHQIANVPLISDHIQTLSANMRSRCALSNADIIRELANS